MWSFARSVSLLASVVVLAACDAAEFPTAPSSARLQPQRGPAFQTGGTERVVEESLYDLTDSYTAIACENGEASELVALSGQIYERFTSMSTPSGASHFAYHTMPVGLRGVGTISGEEYRVKEQEHGSFSQPLMGATGSYRQVLRLDARASGRSFAMVVRGHYTINANGDLVVQREKATFICDG